MIKYTHARKAPTHTMHPDYFGELALMLNEPRHANCIVPCCPAPNLPALVTIPAAEPLAAHCASPVEDVIFLATITGQLVVAGDTGARTQRQ